MNCRIQCRCWLALLTALLSGLLLPCVPAVGAQSTRVELSESRLVFHGLVNEPLQRTFTLTVEGIPIQDLVVLRRDLVDPETGAVILSDDIFVDPASRDELIGTERFTVTIRGGQRAGHYTGSLQFLYATQPPDTSLVMTLDVMLESVPAVDAEVNSKNLTLPAIPDWYSLPFGRPSAPPDAPVLGQVTFSLVQDTDGEAVVEEVDVLTLRAPQGHTPPENTIRVATELPLRLNGRDAVSINVVAAGKNLEAGEYSGTLQVKVRNQPASIQIPIRLRVKDGPLLPLLLLAIGPIVGVLIGWWNRDGRALYDLRKRVARLQRSIEAGELLQFEDRAYAMKELEKVMDAMVAGESAARITEQVQSIERLVEEARTNAQTLLEAGLQPLVGKLRSLDVCKTYRDQLLGQLYSIRGGVTKGEFENLADALSSLREVQTQFNHLLPVIARFNRLSAEERASIRAELDMSTNLEDMREILGMESSSRSESYNAPPVEERLPAHTSWERYTLGLRWRRLLVTAIVYLFTLAVGWVALYVASPIFGADPQDYITIFLWGVASAVVGGQTISLKAIFEKTKEA